MKKIIKGKTYNTETSSVVLKETNTIGECVYVTEYRITRKGDYFSYIHINESETISVEELENVKKHITAVKQPNPVPGIKCEFELGTDKNAKRCELYMWYLCEYHYKECRELKNQIVDFIVSKIDGSDELKEYAKACYEEYPENEYEYGSFEEWFKGSIFNVLGEEGVMDYIGYLGEEHKFDEFNERIGLDEYIKSVSGNKKVTISTKIRNANSLWSYLLGHIEVK